MRSKTDSAIIVKKSNTQTSSQLSNNNIIENDNKSDNDNQENKEDKISDNKEIEKEKMKPKSKFDSTNTDVFTLSNSLKQRPMHPIVQSILSSCKPKPKITGPNHGRKPSIVDKNVHNNKDSKTLNDKLSKIKEKTDTANTTIGDAKKFIEDLKRKLKETTIQQESESEVKLNEKSKEIKEEEESIKIQNKEQKKEIEKDEGEKKENKFLNNINNKEITKNGTRNSSNSPNKKVNISPIKTSYISNKAKSSPPTPNIKNKSIAPTTPKSKNNGKRVSLTFSPKPISQKLTTTSLSSDQEKIISEEIKTEDDQNNQGSIIDDYDSIKNENHSNEIIDEEKESLKTDKEILKRQIETKIEFKNNIDSTNNNNNNDTDIKKLTSNQSPLSSNSENNSKKK